MIVRTLPNGIQTVWQYGPDGRLESITHASADRQVLAEFRYTYRPDNLIQILREWSPRGEKSITYEYDTVQRLTAVMDSERGRTEYHYDPFGNGVELHNSQGTIASSYSWDGRLVSYAGQKARHDVAGNLEAYRGPAGKKELGFDDLNRLETASASRGKVSYQYDGDGQLVTGRWVPAA